MDIAEPPETPPKLPQDNDDIITERQEDERESWDSKLTFLLATIGLDLYIKHIKKIDQ